jgi:hypothetical protein
VLATSVWAGLQELAGPPPAIIIIIIMLRSPSSCSILPRWASILPYPRLDEQGQMHDYMGKKK